MGAELLERAQLVAAIALLLIGVATAWASANTAKRLAGLLIAQIGAMLGLAVLGAPQGAIIAGVALAFALMLVGAALIVRLQEAYGGVEAAEFDAADEQSEPAEPQA